MDSIIGLIEGLWEDAERYGVEPIVFVGLYLVTWPLWYYTMWWVVSGWHHRDRRRMRRGIGVNRLVTVTPYAYVLIAGGENMPWTWYAFALILPLLTTTWFLHKVRDDAWVAKWWTFYRRTLDRSSSRKSGASNGTP